MFGSVKGESRENPSTFGGGFKPREFPRASSGCGSFLEGTLFGVV